jgi:hypothetical protein
MLIEGRAEFLIKESGIFRINCNDHYETREIRELSDESF